MRLDQEDVGHLRTGAMFLACAADPGWCSDQAERVQAHIETFGIEPEIRQVEDFAPEDLIVALGFVNNGLPLSDLRPVGDEFAKSLALVENALGRRAAGVMPLAAANVNAIAPVLSALQLGLPVVDADPMGRVFPLLYQSVLTLAGCSAGPVGTTGAIGESALIEVESPRRAERLVRALAGEFGGWSANALYPVSARQLAEHGVLRSVSRMVRIGRLLESSRSVAAKHAALRTSEGVRRIIRARVSDVAGLSRPAPPGQPDNPSSVVFIEEAHGRLVQLEIQNELLMLMVDGVVEAVVPDIITLLRPEDGSVASLEDLWVGNTLDIVVLPAAQQWYTPEGMALVGPAALNIWVRGREVR